MKELLNARFFSWLEECGGKDVTKDEVELVVGGVRGGFGTDV